MKKRENKIVFYRCYDNEIIKFEIPEDADLDQMLDTFKDFLRGCGYYFGDESTIEIVNNKESEA